MKRKKVDTEPNYIYSNNMVRISKEENENFFEIGKDFTADLAEAIAIMMRKKELSNSTVWNLETTMFNCDISPEKALFWLSGGYTEWRTLEHYNKPWCECFIDFQEEFGFLIVNIIKRSKTLKDVRDGFIKHLNLPILYNFAISKDITK
jgi:hypothetical protein